MIALISFVLTGLFMSTMAIAQEHIQQQTEELSTSKFKLLAIPFYDPSIYSGVSVIPMYSFYANEDQTSPSTLSTTLTYTQSGSYSIRGNTDILLEKLRLVTDFGFNYSDLDVQFFEKARYKASTVQEEFNFFGDLYYALSEVLFIGVGLSYQSERYSGKTQRDRLQLIAAKRCLEYCSDIGSSVSVLMDTRDHYYYPHSGYMLSLTYETHPEWIGNNADDTYSLVDSDFRYYLSLNEDETSILATRWLNRYLLDADNAPASALSLFGRQGRDIQRGFIVGDTMPSANISSLEVEYRHKVVGSGNEYLDKLTLVSMVGVGKSYGRLANPLQQESTFHDADTLSMVGLGLRYRVLPKERINVRMDVTYNNSREWLVYFGLGETI